MLAPGLMIRFPISNGQGGPVAAPCQTDHLILVVSCLPSTAFSFAGLARCGLPAAPIIIVISIRRHRCIILLLIQSLLCCLICLPEIVVSLQLVPELNLPAFLLPEDLIVVKNLRLKVRLQDLAHPRVDLLQPGGNRILIVLNLWLHQLLRYPLVLIVVAFLLVVPDSSYVYVLVYLDLFNQ